MPAGERQAFVAAMRAQGLKDFQVFPQGSRPVVSAIQYLQPLDWRNRLAVGYDMFSQPTRREAMERAALTGLPAMSGKVKLLQDPGRRPRPERSSTCRCGRRTARSATPAPMAREFLSGPGESAVKLATVLQDLRGWAYSPLRIGDLMRASLQSIRNPGLARATVVLYDGTTPQRERQLFLGRGLDGESGPDGPDPGQQGLVPPSHASYQIMDVGGRAWLVGVSSGPPPAALWGLTPAFWLTLALGGSASALLGADGPRAGA